MIITLDTNVLVSGLLSPFRAPGEIVRLVAAGQVQLCVDARIMAEYEEVLHRDKFDFDSERIALLLEQIENNCVVVTQEPITVELTDIDDRVFLEVALMARAEYLVTGNVRHFPLKKRKGMKVVNPEEFIRALES